MVKSRSFRAALRRAPIYACAAATLVGGSAAAADLTLTFPGLKAGGQVVVAVFDSAATWKSTSQPVRDYKLPAADGPVKVVTDLPAGRYAVMAYHDRDGDGRLDTLPVGLPTEPYGFSNNARGAFGPPKWDAAAFQLPAAGAAQTIRLR